MTSVRDILLIAVLLFAVGITIVLSVGIGHQINDNLVLQPSINQSAEAVSVIEHADAALDTSDYLYLACFIGFFIAIVAFGWFVGGSPIMAPIYFFLVIIFSFVAVILQLVWDDLVADVSVAPMAVTMPMTNFILSNLGYFTVIFGLLGIVAMFAKPSETGGVY